MEGAKEKWEQWIEEGIIISELEAEANDADELYLMWSE